MALSKEIEQKAVRDSLLSADRFAEFNSQQASKKAGLRWWHDYSIPGAIFGLLIGVAGLVALAVYLIASLAR